MVTRALTRALTRGLTRGLHGLDVFNPLSISPSLLYSQKPIPGADPAIPILKLRGSPSGDEFDIYGFSPADTRYVQLSPGSGYTQITESVYAIKSYDIAGNGNHAEQTTEVSQPELVWETYTDYPKINFDGSDDYLAVSDDPSLRPGSGNFSILARIKVPFSSNSPSPSWAGIISKGMNTSTGPAGSWALSQFSTNPNIVSFLGATEAGGAFQFSFTSSAMTDGWHTILAMRSGTDLSIHIDGEEDTTETAAVSALDNISDIHIGRNYTPRYLDANISDIAYLGRALTQSEIQKLHRYFA